MAKVFTHEQQVRFSHCDPAGIVYFPDYFDMAHAVMEDWFTHGLGYAYSEMIAVWRVGVPTVHIECDFRKPFRIGDTLHFELRVERIGRSSVNLAYSGRKGATEHLAIRQTICFIHLDKGTPVPVPEAMRGPIEGYMQG